MLDIFGTSIDWCAGRLFELFSVQIGLLKYALNCTHVQSSADILFHMRYACVYSCVANFFRRPCLQDADQKMFSYMILWIIFPYRSGQTGSWWGIRHYTLLDSILDFAWGILAWSVHNSRTDSPSTLRSTCLRNPSPCLLFHWSIVCRYPHQKLSWGHCLYSWLSDSYKYYSDTVGLRRLFPHTWGSAGTLVSVPVFLEVQTRCSNVGFIFARPWRRMHSHAALLQSRTRTCLH